jgi:thiol-disulfide isomerase/thioredoxin
MSLIPIQKMYRTLLILLVALLPLSGLKAQKVEVIHFPDLESWFNADNDTLYVINFWATWCRPCVAEMPYFDQLQTEMGGQKVKVQFVSMDFTSDLDSRLMPFLKRKKPVSSVYLLDEPKYNTWMDKVSEEWSGAIPATIFVQHSRGVRVFHEGEFTYPELKEKVESLMQ